MTSDPNDRDDRGQQQRGLSRRGFLTTMGTGVLTATAAGQLGAQPPAGPAVVAADERIKLGLSINGRPYEVLVEARWSLAYVLREVLQLTGTKVGCDRGECGACTVLLDGAPRYACLTLAVEAEGAEIVTIEGLRAEDGTRHPMQEAFHQNFALQCGYCTPGMLITAIELLRENPNPDEQEVREALSGNLCRCTGYQAIVNAVLAVARKETTG